MNAEAIMTPGGLAAGFQGLINASMQLPAQMQQNRMQQQQQDMDRQRMAMAFENQKRDDAFRQQQFAAQQDQSQWLRGLAERDFGLREVDTFENQLHRQRMEQQQRATLEETKRQHDASQTHQRLVDISEGRAAPTITGAEAPKFMSTAFGAIPMSPGRISMSPDESAARQAFVSRQQDMDLKRRGTEADVKLKEALAEKAKKWTPSTGSSGRNIPLDKLREERNKIFKRYTSRDLTPEEKANLGEQLKEMDDEIARQGSSPGTAEPAATWADLATAYSDE
jgi:hypothetical protein